MDTVGLSYACGSLAVVEAILSTGSVNVNHRDHNGRSALSWAAGYGNVDVVKLLLSRGADARLVDNGGRTAFS